jgi:hypothetical protein
MEERERWGRERLTDGPHLAVTEVKVVGGRQAGGLKGYVGRGIRKPVEKTKGLWQTLASR